MTSTERQLRIRELRRAKSRDWFLIGSGLLISGMIIWSWLSSRPLLGRLPWERRWQNFQRFSGELMPRPVRKSDNWGDALPWAWDLLTEEDGFLALFNTFSIATAAIILAAAVVLPSLTLASRQLSRPSPFGLPTSQAPAGYRWFWRLVGPLVRFGHVLARSIPEYLLAFLLLSLLGPKNVWPLVLALAIHNYGILGRLWGEVIENADTTAAQQRIAAGDTRSNVFATGLFPALFNRFLIYFFYRWETCIKDATVLGMLGIMTLGKLIALSKGFFWDRMFFFILIGASVILVGDLLSTLVRKRLR